MRLISFLRALYYAVPQATYDFKISSRATFFDTKAVNQTVPIPRHSQGRLFRNYYTNRWQPGEKKTRRVRINRFKKKPLSLRHVILGNSSQMPALDVHIGNGFVCTSAFPNIFFIHVPELRVYPPNNFFFACNTIYALLIRLFKKKKKKKPLVFICDKLCVMWLV